MSAPLIHSAMAAEQREQWLKDLFEYELCHECGGDFDNHDCIGSPLGNPFAVCRQVPAPDCPDELRKQLESSQ